MKNSAFLPGLIILFISIQTASAQISIGLPPDIIEIECDNSTQGYDVQLVYDYIDDYTSNDLPINDCTSPTANYTWTHDFTEQEITDCFSSIEVIMTVTNDCGDSDMAYGLVDINDWEGPPLGPPANTEYTLLCDGNGQVAGLQDLIDNDFYFTLEDDLCSGPVELIHDPINFQCNSYETIGFYTEDECGNPSEFYFIDFNIIDLNVEFSSGTVNVLEDASTAEVCLQLSNESPVEVSAEISNIPGTATAGLDYVSVPATQEIVFPSNSTAEQCFSVSLMEDNLIEANETIGFQITNVTSSFLAGIGVDDYTNIFILDNDDDDNDNIENSVDNCPDNFNPYQEDFDGDTIGDVCDTETTISEISEFQDYIYLNKTYSGVIVRSLDDQCWVIVVQNDGSLNTVSVTCPDN